MKRILLLFLVAAATVSRAWNVSAGTWVCNPEASVAVPIEIDDAAGLAYVAVRVNYDPQALVCLRIERGGLDEAFEQRCALEFGVLVVNVFDRNQNFTNGLKEFLFTWMLFLQVGHKLINV
jgi:hypothetical protein